MTLGEGGLPYSLRESDFYLATADSQNENAFDWSADIKFICQNSFTANAYGSLFDFGCRLCIGGTETSMTN